MSEIITIAKKVAAFMGAAILAVSFCGGTMPSQVVMAKESQQNNDNSGNAEKIGTGGGYAVTGQLGAQGYTTEMYDASNGLPTSDANCVLGTRDGYVWIGSYSGILRYDGTVFDKVDTSEGLTSGRGMFEDSQGRVWVGTNDNGVVMIDGEEATWFTYKDGLPSSSIRAFTEDQDGNVYIGTSSGVCYVDNDLKVGIVNDSRINEERILRLDVDSAGVIYGQSKNGYIFSIRNKLVEHCYHSLELGSDKITTILADPERSGYIYLCTEGYEVHYGRFGDVISNMKHIYVAPLKGVHWISYDCGRVWLASISQVGYLDQNRSFTLISDLPMNSGIEMMTSDYQGNMWFASSTRGVMKVVASNFIDLTQKTGLQKEVSNTTCLINERLYVGTDDGLRILEKNKTVISNKLTEYIGHARVRCLEKDLDGNLWISTFTDNLGLVCYTKRDRDIKAFTTNEGLPSNEIRCTKVRSDGAILVGTNSGLAVIEHGYVTRRIDSKYGVKNAVFLTVEEGENGEIYAGTDGDGIYVINGQDIQRIGREEGLTSDVIMRIKKDEKRGVYWIVTSNSIMYIKNGLISTVTSFPYNNNYDIYFDKNDSVWIVSSYGIYTVAAEQMIADNVADYRLFGLSNGLTSTPTSNSYGELDGSGNLYIPCRMGVCKVNIDNFYGGEMEVKATVKAVYFGDEKILPQDRRYTLPAETGRVKITPSVLDYTLADPLVHIYMEGDEKDEVWVQKSKITTIEYTGMKDGEYKLHIQVMAGNRTDVMLDEIYTIVKQPRLTELLLIRILFFVLTAVLAGLFVWRLMKNTIIRRQYDEIKQAKEDAERANSAKTRFLANISHEIRTPINTIMGMDEMIMREDPTNVPKGYFLAMVNYAFDIKNAAETLLGLINDLLDISKIESGKMHLVEQEYDTAELLRSLVSMIRVKATEKELIFDVAVDEILPQKLYGDAGKIKQIVLNLLTNAVKYTEKGGLILSVSANERTNDELWVNFYVKDTGIGVKEEDKEKLFEAYERLDEQKNSAIQGTGLGLDISKKFAELMGGTLTCESVYGKGSEFILSIKQKIVDSSPMGLFVEHDEKAAKGPYVPQFIAPDADVLVVDDTPMNLTVIKNLLKATKIFVTTASSGEECLEKMKTTRFNIVLLDHMMPGMDGIETVARIRENDPDIPVYALTANATAGEEFYKSKGFTGYLSKPIDSEKLEKTIMKHLPEEIMFKPEAADAVEELQEMPDDMKWIYETEGINVEEGIKNSGGISSYIFSLKLFYDTIDGNAKIITEAYNAGDIRLYTIKVHALKSSCRIIGAEELAQLAASLEDAGNKEDTEFIDLHTDELLCGYAAYKNKLSRLGQGEEDQNSADKKDIPEDELKDAFEALKEFIPQMDYDAVEMVLNQLKEYNLPKEEGEKIAELRKMLKTFDWEGMEALVSD